MADPKKECEYQASLERTGFLTTGQPATLTEPETRLSSQGLTPGYTPCHLSIGKLFLEADYMSTHPQGVSYIFSIF